MIPTENSIVSMINSSPFEGLLVPISQKGGFFHDDFFRKAHESFVLAVQNVMSRHNAQSHQLISQFNHNNLSNFHNLWDTDLFSSYRNLRLNNLCEGNQAVTVTKHGNVHQVRTTFS